MIGGDEAVLLGVWQDIANGQIVNSEATLALIADEDVGKVNTHAMLTASNVFSTKNALPFGLAVHANLSA